MSPAKLAHVVLRTSNFNNMVQFYKTFLGASAMFENDDMCFMTYDEEHHRIGIMNFPNLGPKNTQTAGLEHIAFTFNTLRDLTTSYTQRKEHGISPFWTINHGPTTSVYYKDPDGNVLETQVDNFDTPEESIAFGKSDAYKVNPIGVDFEMEELIGKLDSGVKEEDLKVRPESGPRGPDSVPS